MSAPRNCRRLSTRRPSEAQGPEIPPLRSRCRFCENSDPKKRESMRSCIRQSSLKGSYGLSERKFEKSRKTRRRDLGAALPGYERRKQAGGEYSSRRPDLWPYLISSARLLPTPSTRKRPPRSGFVQTTLWKVSPDNPSVLQAALFICLSTAMLVENSQLHYFRLSWITKIEAERHS